MGTDGLEGLERLIPGTGTAAGIFIWLDDLPGTFWATAGRCPEPARVATYWPDGGLGTAGAGGITAGRWVESGRRAASPGPRSGRRVTGQITTQGSCLIPQCAHRPSLTIPVAHVLDKNEGGTIAQFTRKRELSSRGETPGHGCASPC